MRKIASILFLVVFGMILTSCANITLQTPIVTLSGDVISWDAVEGATQYYVYIDDTATSEPETNYFTVTDTSYDLTSANLADGTYSVYVVAVAGTSFSGNSSSVTYVVGDGGGLTLDAPTNVAVNGNQLSWNAVTNATGYTIHITTTSVNLTVNVTGTSYDLTAQSLAEGSYVIFVVATAGTVVSGNSNSVNYVVATAVSLNTPTNVSLVDGVISWQAVTGATGYIILINGDEIAVTTTSYDLTQVTLVPGDYPVTVKATATLQESLYTNAVTYTVVSTVNQDDIIAGVLSIIDPSYEPDMVLADFESQLDFDSYTNALNTATAYAAASYSAGLAATDAIGFFGAIIGLVQAPEPPDSLESFLSATDIFDTYNVTPATAAALVYSFLDMAMDVGTMEFNSQLTYLQTELTSQQSYINDLLGNSSYTAFLQMVANHVPLAAASTAAQIAAGGEQGAELLQLLMVIGIDRYYGNNNTKEDYYGFNRRLSHEQVDALVLIVDEFESDAAVNLVVFEQNNNAVHNVVIAYETLRHMTEEMNRMTLIIARFGDLQTLLSDDPTVFRASLTNMFEFAMTIRDSIPANVVTLIDSAMSGETLTMTEMMLIKDEIISLISTAMPSKTDYQTFFEALLMIGEVVLGNDINNLTEHADYLGSVSYYSVELGLAFIGSVSATDVSTAQPIIEAFIQTYQTEGVTPLDNPTPLINLLVYVRNYLDAFATDNATTISELETLLGASAVEPLYQEVITQLINFATEQNPEEVDMILYILNSASGEYDQLIALLQAAKNVETGLVNAFIDSNASILTVINSMQNIDQGDLAAMTSALESFIDEVALYHGVLVSELTAANFEDVLSILVIPVMVQTGAYMEDPAVTEPAIRALIPDLAQVLENIVSLEGDLFTGVNGLVISDYINATLGFNEPVDVGSALALIHVLDGVLTTDNETLINDTIDIIFTDILGDSTVQALGEITPSDLADVRTNLETMISDIITNIHTCAAYNISTLTFEQEKAVMQLADMLNLYINTRPSMDDMISHALPLTLDTTDTSVYYTDPVVYAFTPTVAGYYSFTATFQEVHEANIQVYDGANRYLTSVWNEDTSITASGFLYPDTTIYLQLDIRDGVYVDVDAIVSESTDIAALALDTPVDLSYSTEMYYYKFTPATDGFYQFVIESGVGEDANGMITIRDGHGYDIVSNGFYVNDGTQKYYVQGEAGVPIYLEIFPYFSSEQFTLTVMDFNATVITPGVSTTVTYSANPQYFVFMLDEGEQGFFDLNLTATEMVNTELRYFATDNENNPMQEAWYNIDVGSNNYSRNFLQPNILYIIEISNMTVDKTFDLNMIGVPTETLTTATDLNSDLLAYEEVFFTFVVTDMGNYQFDFTSDVTGNLQLDMLTSEGWYVTNFYGNVDSTTGYHPTIFLYPGSYFGSFFIEVDANLTVGLTELQTPTVTLGEEIFVETTNYMPDIVLFTPDTSGEYVVYSYDENGSNPYVEIWSSDGYQVNYFDGNMDNNFEGHMYLQAGQTYVLKFNNHDNNTSYNATIELDHAYVD